MRNEADILIHHAIENETAGFREDTRYGCIMKNKVLYIVHEAGVSAYYGDFYIGEFATQTEAVRKVSDMADNYI